MLTEELMVYTNNALLEILNIYLLIGVLGWYIQTTGDRFFKMVLLERQTPISNKSLFLF